MDFLVSSSEPKSDAVIQRYDVSQQTDRFWFGHVSSGNLEVLEATTDARTVVAGSLFGPLADHSEGARGGPDAKHLGEQALASDGSFALARAQKNSVVVVTDAGGSIPVYYGHGPNGLSVGTVVHHVASCAGLTSIDEVSVVDYLLNSTVCYPYSWYEDIRLSPPGSVSTFFADGDQKRHTYWKPVEPDNIYEPCDEGEWGRRLHDQVSTSIERSIQDKNDGRLLYSGGSDSRAILSLVPQSFPCTPTTVLDQKNREYRLAKRSASLLGRRLDWIPRPDDFYRSAVRERIDIVGPGRDFRHTHFLGPAAEKYDKSSLLLGGYLSDTLFKTNNIKNIKKRVGRPDRLLEPSPDKIADPNLVEGGVSIASLWSSIINDVRSRRREHHERLKEMRPLTAGNWHSLWPLSGLNHYDHYLSTKRMSPEVIEPFLFSQAYQLAAEMPDTARVDRRAFRSAFAKEMGMAGWWPTSSGRIPRLRGWSGSLAKCYLDWWRLAKHYLYGQSRGQGPWPTDHTGWDPIRPENHFEQEECELLRSRLDEVLVDGRGSGFFREEGVPVGMKVRALTLAFSIS